MSTPIVATKLYIPPPRPKAVLRPRLVDHLNEGVCRNQGFGCKLTLISAPAGFGKTTLISAWVASCDQLEPKVRVAWLSLDAGDSDPARFLTYLIAALQTIAANLGAGMLGPLQSPQPPPTEAILTALINEITAVQDDFLLVLDDYHAIDASPSMDGAPSIDSALTFLLDHLPPPMHLVIATREDPHLPLARLRARGQLTELRAADLRFTPAEAAEFLNRVMGLNLSAEDIAALETRTEGWIAGLQLAAISMRGHHDVTGFIRSFTGSHHFVLDYLVEEVLQQQTASVQAFLLQTAILDRMCGPLCDAVLQGDLSPTPSASGQEILEYLEHANLFVVPLDNERRWYRYHHLFGELLRQRLQQSLASPAGDGERSGAELHSRASQWYEDHGLEIEAFRHAAAAHDIERAERLIKGGGIPLHSLAAVTAIIDWLDSLPKTALDARPWLWVRSGTSMLMAGQTTGVEEKLQAAEAALATAGAGARAGAMQSADLNDEVCDLIGQIASVRATLAILRYEPEAAILQARRALEYLPPDSLPARGRAIWTLGLAYQLQGDRAAARRIYGEAMAIRQTSGNVYFTIMATTGLGQVQESDNQLHEAAESYRRSLQLFGDKEPPNASEEFIGLARICYQWNDLEAAEEYGRQSVELARRYDPAIDRAIISEVFVARLKLSRGDAGGAAAILAEAQQSAERRNFILRLPEIAAVQVLVLLRQGQLAAAAQLARQYELPLSQARVLLAQGDASEALAVLAAYRQQMEVKGWVDERLKALVLQVVALQAHGEKDQALRLLGDALAVAEPGGFIRLFVDEGESMQLLICEYRRLAEKQSRERLQPQSGYLDRLLAAFAPSAVPPAQTPSGVVEPLSPRELEILRLIAQGLSNRDIGARLFLALNTVKGHNRVIFDKLQVERRTEAIARARELGLL